MGRIQMSDDWWSEREKECPGIRKAAGEGIPNMDLFAEEFHGTIVTGAEGWSAQHGEASLSSRVGGDDGDDGDEAETQVIEKETQPQTQPQTHTQTQTQAGNSRAKRKRKEKDMAVEACVKRTEALEMKNRIAEQMLEREHAMLERERAASIDNVIDTLNGLPGVRKWSLFHKAAIEHLIDSEGDRRGFISFELAEDKIKFLELRTGRKIDD